MLVYALYFVSYGQKHAQNTHIHAVSPYMVGVLFYSGTENPDRKYCFPPRAEVAFHRLLPSVLHSTKVDHFYLDKRCIVNSVVIVSCVVQS